ncbi:transcriptional activator protein Pur-beta isoform X2 [Frieseomelitta varia]|uniref:transcriptional activator protein Pur-beta isoform X2 n=1 Tax=Frieseomelitta varia TaxID=561572 RepID=UPI001CB690A3|nr:transcriptional activator protein Pur-beta isoform X2 [Frieseomelitta varia]
MCATVDIFLPVAPCAAPPICRIFQGDLSPVPIPGSLQQSSQQGQQGEQELATKMLQIQSKRFYLDVKQNRRGRFIKVAEIGADGRRSQIYLALSTASEFRNYLSTFSDFYASLGPPNSENVPDDGKLKSEVMTKDNRRYYLDLKENTRGRFLRVSQTITRGGPRTQIAIPAQGMIEFRDALTDLLEEYGTDDGGFKGDLPEGRYMRVDSKNFYFDIGQNNRGIYMRISEVKTHFRTAITVPEKSWERFRDIFADYCERMRERGAGSNVGMNSGGGGNVLPEGRGSVVAQVTQKPAGVKSKTEKRQADQRQRESLKRRKSLPRQAEPSALNPEKSMSAPASQVPTTIDIPLSSGSTITTSSTSKSTMSEENVSSGSTASQEIQGMPRLETVQV